MQPNLFTIKDYLPENFALPDVDMPAVTAFGSLLFSCFMVFGGAAPYIPQYIEIRKSKNADGFSTFVCFVLLIANTLRIMFWFGKKFELPLLFQSIVIDLTMLAMLQLCTSVKSSTEIVSSKSRRFSDGVSGVLALKHHPRRFLDFDAKYFWKWTDFTSYLQFLALFVIISGATTYVFLSTSLYIESLGFAALFIEAMLGTPQFYRNFQNKSTKGMSMPMVLLWLVGDVAKTVYFVIRQAPIQFWLCGFLQIAIDLAILAQVWYYGSKAAVQ